MYQSLSCGSSAASWNWGWNSQNHEYALPLGSLGLCQQGAQEEETRICFCCFLWVSRLLPVSERFPSNAPSPGWGSAFLLLRLHAAYSFPDPCRPDPVWPALRSQHEPARTSFSETWVPAPLAPSRDFRDTNSRLWTASSEITFSSWSPGLFMTALVIQSVILFLNSIVYVFFLASNKSLIFYMNFDYPATNLVWFLHCFHSA